MLARLLAAVGVALVVVGVLTTMFDTAWRAPRTIILVGGVLCLVAYLVLDRMGRRW